MDLFMRGGFRMSVEGKCLDEKKLPRLIGKPLYTVELNNGDQRKMTLIDNGPERYFVDLITGSLYNRDGECLTSNRLRVVGPPMKTGQKVTKNHLSPTYRGA